MCHCLLLHDQELNLFNRSMPEATLVTIAYTVRPEKHDEYRALMKGLVEKINQQAGVSCTLYKVDGQATSYVEVYMSPSIESYDALEDNLDEASRDTINRIAAEFVTNRQAVTTLQRAA